MTTTMRFRRPVVVGLLSLAAAVVLASCAGAVPTPAPAQVPMPSGDATTPTRRTAAQPVPLVSTTWPTRTREHVDLWLHTYAMLAPDTTLVPYFRRGYRDRMLALRKQRTLLDDTRDRLNARIAVEPSLATAGQFLPLYFPSWAQMRQTIDEFIRRGGVASASGDPNAPMYFAVLGASFQTGADREWLRQFVEAADDESRKFYHEYWTAQEREHAHVVLHTDSLWQQQWRPALQRFLNNTQQQNGELYLSLPLGGEGRTVHYGKADNAVAGPMPESIGESESVLFVMAHEVTGAMASAAIADNTSPADQREGLTARYEQAAAVRAGALLIEKTIPTALPGYMRFYLLQAGRASPTDPRAAFATAFPLPQAMLTAISRQLDVILGGI